MNAIIRWAMVALQMLLASVCAAQSTVTVIEYYNNPLDAYFITGRASEQAVLDSFPASFRRTGATFQATSAETATSDLERICRFYISLPAPNYTSSHFYGRANGDCSLILTINPAGFSFEGYDFAVRTPVSSACTSSHPVKVYRALRRWTASKTSNHRYSTSLASHLAAVASGWTDEGAVFCVSGATDIASTPPAVSSAGGLWSGQTDTNRNVFGIIPPDGQAWVMYTDVSGKNTLSGALQGTVSWSGGNWSLTNARDFSLEVRAYGVVSGSGSFVARTYLNGTLHYPTLGQVTTFTSNFNSAYELTPSVGGIAGTYSGQASSFVRNEATTLTVASNGSASGRSAGGCGFTGNVSLYQGANLYRITLTFQGGVCLAGTATFSGVAYYDSPSRNLYGLVLDNARTTPFFFIGAR